MQNVNSETMRLNYVESRKEWRMAKGMGHAQGPGNYPELTVQPNHTGKFTFKILNPDDVTFAAKDPFVPKAGKTNPGDFKHQFSWDGEGTDTLTVYVKNNNANGGSYDGGVYHYQLQFNKAVPLDPIISNLGCCQKIAGGSNLAAYSLGAVGILALGVVAYKLLRR